MCTPNPRCNRCGERILQLGDGSWDHVDTVTNLLEDPQPDHPVTPASAVDAAEIDSLVAAGHRVGMARGRDPDREEVPAHLLPLLDDVVEGRAPTYVDDANRTRGRELIHRLAAARDDTTVQHLLDNADVYTLRHAAQMAGAPVTASAPDMRRSLMDAYRAGQQ